jgi:hypothetical protein
MSVLCDGFPFTDGCVQQLLPTPLSSSWLSKSELISSLFSGLNMQEDLLRHDSTPPPHLPTLPWHDSLKSPPPPDGTGLAPLQPMGISASSHNQLMDGFLSVTRLSSSSSLVRPPSPRLDSETGIKSAKALALVLQPFLQLFWDFRALAF